MNQIKEVLSYTGSLICRITKRIPSSVKLSALLVMLCALSFQYYYYPTSLFMSNGKSVSASGTVANGISGGSIIGDSKYGGKNLPIYSVENKRTDENGTVKKMASLSFDAAWGDEDTIQILDILDKYNIKVTFFMTGEWVAKYPDKVQEIYKRGHDLGNHSENHKNMSKLPTPQQKDEIMKVDEKVLSLTGYKMFLFRPPFGDYDNTLIDTTYSCNYYPIQWSVDSLDWKDYGADNIVNSVLNHKDLTNGSIILMHNGAKYTKDALEQVITGLQSQGFDLVPISGLIYRENFHMDNKGMQIENQ